MIRNIFSSNFYSLFSAPNKEEIIKSLKNIKVDSVATKEIKWNSGCNVDVEVLDTSVLANILAPSLKIFLSELGYGKKDVPIKVLSGWRNIYQKGGFQETHDHLGGDGREDCHLSGCFFLDDFDNDAGTFSFYNRHSSELNIVWRKIFTSLYSMNNITTHGIMPKAGDILFFPSYMLHGVTQHRLRKPRTTVSFNIQFI